MIFYFSGTGNSLWAAKYMSVALSEKIISIADFHKSEKTPSFSLEKGERIGFVFPIHSWGVPPIVKRFLQDVQFVNYDNNLIYTIVTCGDMCGYANLMVQEILNKKNMECRHIYSVQMPNSYIVFPGFDVDSKEVETNKKEAAKITMQAISNAIINDKPIQQYVRGGSPFLKSRIIYPMFCKYVMNAKPFYTTEQCNSCGLCARKCPTKNIEMIDGRPHWNNDCTQCLACIHHCPTKAIEYGKVTQNKGRYFYS